MKNSSLLALLFCCLIVPISCNEDDTEDSGLIGQTTPASGVLTEEEVRQIGYAHNVGLNAVINSGIFKQGSEGARIATSGINSKQDSTLLLRLIRNEVRKFMVNHPFYYRERRITFSEVSRMLEGVNSHRFDDRRLLDLARQSIKGFTSNQKRFYGYIVNNVDDYQDNPQAAHGRVEGILASAKSQMSYNEYLPIEVMGTMATYSHYYWTAFPRPQAALRLSAPGPCVKFPGVGIITADIFGGGKSALTGLAFAGPAGAVIVGTTGALITSSFAYATSLAACGFTQMSKGGSPRPINPSTGQPANVNGHGVGNQPLPDPFPEPSEEPKNPDNPCDEIRRRVASTRGIKGEAVVVPLPCDGFKEGRP